jgi:hypothetical protein
VINLIRPGYWLQALDLSCRSDADPRELLQQLAQRGIMQELAVNDLEQPAFDMYAALFPLETGIIL